MALRWAACRTAIDPCTDGIEMSVTTYILDRVEDDARAVLEPASGEGCLEIPRTWLPVDAAEGDVIRVERAERGLIRFRVDAEASADRRERMRELRDRIPRGPGGDLEL